MRWLKIFVSKYIIPYYCIVTIKSIFNHLNFTPSLITIVGFVEKKQNNMASNSEVGHAKNVANFEKLISFCNGYGGSYNPSKNSIKLTALNTLLADAQAAVAKVTTQTVAYNNTVNTRMQLFDPIKKLSTRLVNALNATDASNETKADAKSVNKKIQGQRATAKKEEVVNPDPNQPAPDTISTSQQSYDQLTEHFNKMLEILSAETTYTPNETDLQITTLNNLLKDMHVANTSVANAYTDVSNTRIGRNKILYTQPNNLCSSAQEVKNYVKSLFGTTSPEFKQVNKIPFRVR